MDEPLAGNEVRGEPAAQGPRLTVRPTLFPTLAGSVYVLVVAAIATRGFATDSPATILLAGLLALPASVPAVIGYYIAYGLLALLPGANPSSSSGSGSCSPNGDCQVSTTGDPAVWFTVTTDVIGVLALAAAAVLNVMLLRSLVARRRR